MIRHGSLTGRLGDRPLFTCLDDRRPQTLLKTSTHLSSSVPGMKQNSFEGSDENFVSFHTKLLCSAGFLPFILRLKYFTYPLNFHFFHSKEINMGFPVDITRSGSHDMHIM